MSSVMETSPSLPASCPGEAREPRPPMPAGISRCRLYLSTTLCSILLAFLLVMVGVSVTSMMFHNAKTAENKVFPIGPLLLIAGLLSIGRVLLQRRQVMEQRLRLERHRRRLSGHVVRTAQSLEQRRPDEAAICLGPPSFDEIPSYNDELPPAYELVATNDRPSPVYAADNMRVYSTVAMQTSQRDGATNMALLNDADQLMLLPPSYDEVLRLQQDAVSTTPAAQHIAAPTGNNV